MANTNKQRGNNLEWESMGDWLTTTQTPCLNPEKRMHLASKLVKIHSYSCWVCLSAFSFQLWQVDHMVLGFTPIRNLSNCSLNPDSPCATVWLVSAYKEIPGFMVLQVKLLEKIKNKKKIKINRTSS